MSSEAVSKSQALIAFFLGTIFFFYAFIQRVAPSVMTDELMRDFAVGGTALGVLSATYFYTYAFMQLPVGVLMDRFGPRKLMSLTALVCAVASFWFASSETLLSASVSRALIGGSVAFAFVGTLTIVTAFFPPKRFAMLAGTLMSVGMCGAIMGQAPVRYLLEVVGWRSIFLQLAVFAIALAVLIFLLVPRRVQNNASEKSETVSVMTGLREVVTNRQSWWAAGAGFGFTATMLSFAGLWAVPWLTTTVGMTNKVAAVTASMLFVGWAMGSPVMGWLSDKMGRRKPILAAGGVLALLTLVLILFGGFSSPLVYSFLFWLNGLSASAMVLCFALVRETNVPRNNATAIGLVNMCVVGSGAVMQPLIGWLLDSKWQGDLNDGARVYTSATYDFALTSLIIVVLFALFCVFMVRETHCRPLKL